MSSDLVDQLSGPAQRFDVIVHVTATDEARQPLRSHDRGPEDLRRAVIGPLMQRELKQLRQRLPADDLRVHRTLCLQPAFAATVSRRGLTRLAEHPAVRFIEQDLRWQVHTAEGLPLIGAPSAHTLGYTGSGTAIAIIDTGVDALHPALGGRRMPNGKVVYGLDTADLDLDPTDCGTHGTAVAAVAAGYSYQWNPYSRFAGGVAPDAAILAYKASPDSECGTLYLSAVLAAIEDAILHRVGEGYTLAAINISGGAGVFSLPCDDQISSYRNAAVDALSVGVPLVASAGNDGSNDGIAAPACLSQVISVGSVWDVDSGWVGYSFCLDPECSALCDDSYRPASSMTCYSNSAPTLDVLAPAEYLTTAEAGAHTTHFGGTSGAAAYAAGALAIMKQVQPDADPAATRLRLQLSGKRVLDHRTGLLHPLIDLARATVPDHMAAAAPRSPIAPGSEHATTSEVIVAPDGVVGSVRVILHLMHDHVGSVSVRLRAPDGTEVRLHDHGAGNLTDTGDAECSLGIWGSYPDQLTPVESLGVLGGRKMGGSWTLIVEAAAGTGVLVDWGLIIDPLSPLTPEPDLAISVPVVAHLAGVSGATWVSDVTLFNPSPSRSATLRLALVPSRTDGTALHHQAELFVGPQATIAVSDVTSTLFGLRQVSGHLLLQSSVPELLVSSRTGTIGDHGGGYGQFIEGVSATEDTLAVGSPPLVLCHLDETESFRTNVGFSEISGHPVTLQVIVFDGTTGAPLSAPRPYVLKPFSHLQFRLPTGGRRRNLYAVVAAVEGAGRALAYASRVDNASQDAMYIAGRRPLESGQLVLPVVARTRGSLGTDWRTELRIANLGDTSTRLELEYRHHLGILGAPHRMTLEIPGGRVFTTDDLLFELFGVSGTMGSLRIIAAGNPVPLLVSSRTYSMSESGTYGQFVGAVGHGSRDRAAVIIPAPRGSTRTNLGLCEVAGGQLRVRCEGVDALGRTTGIDWQVTLGPYQMAQVNDLTARSDVSDREIFRFDITAVEGDGAFTAYASVADSATGDAFYVPAHSLPP
jgi:subtilisin-like proprotein convertase family protein